MSSQLPHRAPASISPILFLYFILFLLPYPLLAAAHCIELNSPYNSKYNSQFDFLPERCGPIHFSAHLDALFGKYSSEATHSCPAFCNNPWESLEEITLQIEIERWLRANRTVGMFPEAYDFVRSELLRLIANEEKENNNNNNISDNDSVAARIKAKLREMPWLLVNNETLHAAYNFYHRNIRQRHIVRSLHLSQATAGADDIREYLLQVSNWWNEAERRVMKDPRVSVPFLPWISLDDFIQPQHNIIIHNSSFHNNNNNNNNNSNVTNINRKGSTIRQKHYRFFPPRLPLPTAVVYHYSKDCPACEAFGVAFDLLPIIYRRICEYGHPSIISCSPLILFIRAVSPPSHFISPTLTLYGMQRQSIAPVSKFISFLVDVDEYFNPNDALDGIMLPLGTDTRVANVLVEILRRLTTWGILQLRFLTPAEIAEMDRLEHERLKEEKEQKAMLNNNNNNNNTNLTSTTDEEEDQETQKQSKKGLALKRGRVITLEDHLRGVVNFHMHELWGNSTRDIENRGSFSWSQLEPLWLKVVCFVLSFLWLILLKWPPRGSRV